jgi:PAS domain S-box-containing protein
MTEKNNDKNLHNVNIEKSEQLRKKAKEKIQQDIQNSDYNENTGPLTKESIIQELRIRKAELEIQNEELIRSREELEISRNKYSNLFEFAPIGYFTLSIYGIIEEVNLTATNILGRSRNEIINKPLNLFINKKDIAKFTNHIKNVMNNSKRLNCEIGIDNKKENKTIFVRLESIYAEEQSEKQKRRKIYMAVIDISDKVRTQKSLEESEKKYHQLFSNILNGFGYYKLITDKHNKASDIVFLEVNQAFVDIIGISKEKLIGNRATEFFPNLKTSETKWLEAFSNVALKQEELRFEIYSEERGKWFSVYAFCPKKGYFATILEDSTERKEVINKIKESEKRYEAVIDAQPNLICRFTPPDGKVSFVNKSICDRLEKSKEELIGQYSIIDFVHKEDLLKAKQNLAELTATNKDSVSQYRVVTPKGILWMEWSTKALFNDKGQLVEYQSVGRDITEQKEAERSLQENQLKYKKIIEIANDSVLIADGDTGIILDANKKASELLSLPVEKIIGMHQTQIHPHETKEEMKKGFEDVYKYGHFHIDTVFLYSSKGEIIPVEVSSSSVKLNDRTIVIGIFRDIRDRIAMYKKLEKTNTDLEEANEEIRATNEELETTNDSLKEANEELEDLKSKLEAIVNNFPNGAVMLFDKNLKYLIARGKGVSQLDYKVKNMEGKTVWEVFPEGLIEKIVKYYEKALQGEYNEFEIGYQERIYLYVYTLPVKNEFGEVVLGMSMIQDISLQKEMNKELQKIYKQIEKREALYRAVVEDQTELICRYTSDRKITFVNEAYCRYYNKTKDELIGKEFELRIIDEDKSILENSLSSLNIENKVSTAEYRMKMTRGKIRWQRWINRAIYNSDKQLIEYQSVGRDITEKKQMGMALLESEEKFRSIFEESPIGIMLFDRMGSIIWHNEAVMKITGIKDIEGLKRNYNLFEDKFIPKEAIEKIKNKQKARYEISIDIDELKKTVPYLDIQKSGTVYRDFSLAPIYADKDRKQVTGYFVFTMDITERKESDQSLQQSMEELKRSNEELEQFANIVSHDLKNPLNVVISYVDIIKNNYGDKLDERGLKMSEMVKDRTLQMIHMIDRLLSYSQIRSDENLFEYIDTEIILKKALDNLEIEIKETKTEITHDKLPAIKADETQMISVFQNIIGNSIKYSKKGVTPKINISAEEKENEWLFTITDNGIGIEEDQKEKIFLIFHRIDKKNNTGHGIGLAFCKKCIKNHKGKIWAESVKDEGTTFYFTINKNL